MPNAAGWALIVASCKTLTIARRLYIVLSCDYIAADHMVSTRPKTSIRFKLELKNVTLKLHDKPQIDDGSGQLNLNNWCRSLSETTKFRTILDFYRSEKEGEF